MTASNRTPRRASSGCTWAALPCSAIDSGVRPRRACSAQPSASSSESVMRSTYPSLSLRSMRSRSISTKSPTPPLSVTASGWAPPMPPSPAESTSRPASVPPKCVRAQAPNVS